MGHYCYDCGEKLMGGVVPRECDCIECYCSGCWERLWTCDYTEIKDMQWCGQPVYIKQTTNVDQVKCPECGEEWTNDPKEY